MIKVLLLSFSCLCLVTGCSLKNSYADVSYQPSRLQAASSWKGVTVHVTDRRAHEAVGYRENLIGMKTAQVLPSKNMATSLQEFFEKAFSSSFSSSHHTLFLTINTCFTHCEQTLFYKKAVANLSLDITLFNEEGLSLHKKTIKTQGIELPVFFYSGKNISKAIKKAFQSALEELLKDDLLIKELQR
jgi:uncharacterized lipoprotein YajG